MLIYLIYHLLKSSNTLKKENAELEAEIKELKISNQKHFLE